MKMKKIFLATFVLIVFSSLNILAQHSSTYFPRNTPEAEGIKSSAILEFIERAEKEIDAMHSFMIIRHGNLIAEGWWDPYSPESPHVMHSLSKSFTSTAVGFAVEEGLISLNDLVISFFPDRIQKDLDWQWKEMRIKDLLTMNTGQINEPWPQEDITDWVQYFLDSEVELMPGTHFKYNSPATYVLSAILQKVSGEKLVDFLDTRFFQPLEIKKPEWDTCPRGINTGGWGLHIVTEDIAKLGQFYLQKGNWKGKQLISKHWVEMATSKQVSNGSNPESDWAQGYGFQFWRSRHNTYRGDGAMGQFCLIMPKQDAVIAITAGTNDLSGIIQLVWDVLLPAMKETKYASNVTEVSKLQKKTQHLKIPIIEGHQKLKGSKSLNGKKFIMAENTAGLKAVSFYLESDSPNITMEMEGGEEIIKISPEGYEKGTLTSHLPYAKNALYKVAANGVWTKADEYQLRIYFHESPERITYTFHFENDNLVMDSNLEFSFSKTKEDQLIGKSLDPNK